MERKNKRELIENRLKNIFAALKEPPLNLDVDEVGEQIDITGFKLLIAIKTNGDPNKPFDSLFVGKENVPYKCDTARKAVGSSVNIIKRIILGKKISGPNVLIFAEAVRKKKIVLVK